jgi:hypothetical protein
MRRYSITAGGVIAGVALFLTGVMVADMTRDNADETVAIELPSACDNFVAASEIFAQHGAQGALTAGGADPLAADADQRAYEMLLELLVSCDQQLASQAR